MFGTYDRTYTSNVMFRQAMERNNIPYSEVNASIQVTKLDQHSDMTWFHIVRRILQKYTIIPTTIKHWKTILECDLLYVGYPGHFDVLFAWIVAKLAGKKLVFNPLLIIYTGFSEEQGILSKSSLLGKGVKFFESMVYRMCDLVFADTQLQKHYLMEVFNVPEEKLRVLAIGADDVYYEYTPYRNSSKKIEVTYYGLYSPIHGVEHIIEAARLLRDNSDIHFSMVGQGHTFKENYNRAQKLKLKNITFYNDIPLAEHPAKIKKADIFFGFLTSHPTVQRVIPNKIYQGLALGKVVMSSDAPVTRAQFVHKDTIYLVAPDNPAKIVEALIELQKKPSLRKHIADNGHELFTREYTPQAVGNKFYEHCCDLLKGINA